MNTGIASEDGAETNDLRVMLPSSADHVAPLLPATAQPPLPARRVGFLRAFLLFWLMPRRYGPHLAVGSLRRAVMAHVLAVVLAGSVAGATAAFVLGLGNGWHWAGSLHQLRVELANMVLNMAAQSTTGSWSWIPVVMVLGAIPFAEIGIVLLGILLMPWCADGDSARSVFRRSLKNVYWSTTGLVPLSILWPAIIFLSRSDAGWLKSRFDVLGLAVVIGGVAFSALLVVRTLFVGAHRYAGEPEGPAFRPREPHCDQCGYLVVGLPLTALCPECGLPVSESLPGGRRQPTEWQKSELSSAGFTDLLRTQWRVLWDPSFFQRLPVQQSLRSARHFWWGTYMLIACALLLAVRIMMWVAQDVWGVAMYPAWAIVALVLPILSQLLVMFGACMWSQVAHGMRDYRVAATTCYYASPLMWPAAVVLMAAMISFGVPGSEPWERVEVEVMGYALTLRELGLVVLGILFILAGLFWLRRLSRCLHDVRYANV